MRASKRVGRITRCKRLVAGAYTLWGDAWLKENKKLKPQAIASSMLALLLFGLVLIF